MYLYNITIKVDPEIDQEFIDWQIKVHIPEIMATGMFRESRLCRLLEQDESDGKTYSVQFMASSLEHYNRYISEFAPALRKKSLQRWGNRMIAFRTLMEIVN